MPIHDQSYRRYHGERMPQGRSWTVIARAGVKSMIGKRKFLGLLLLAWLPFLVRAVQFYIAAKFPQASIIAPTAQTFREFVEQQGAFGFFVTIYTGAGLIANDLRANALQIYLAKPLGRAEYIAGKFAVLATFLLLVTFMPAFMLLFVQVILAGSVTFLLNNFFLLPAIIVYTFTETLVLAIIMLALSSLTKSARFVGIMFAGMYFFTVALFHSIKGVTHSSNFAWLSPTACFELYGDVIFRQPPRYDTPFIVVLLALVGMVALAGFILERRVRGVEVVA
jgi:ABC-2 type transport system permease protein